MNTKNYNCRCDNCINERRQTGIHLLKIEKDKELHEMTTEELDKCHDDIENNKSDIEEDWNGILTFDDMKNIIESCYVKHVELKQDSILINFAPSNVIGSQWKELKEKMLLIGKKK